MALNRSLGGLWSGKVTYYCQRIVILPWLRALVVRVLGTWIGKRKRGSVHPMLNTVKERGIAQLGQVLNDEHCAEVLAYLADKPVYDHHVTVAHAFSEDQPADMSFGIHSIADVIDCPHLLELVSRPEIVQLATDYLGCTPTLSCLGVQWSFPTESPRVAQKFHRDSEDWKYLRFLIYLTDVDSGSGPHVYVTGTHKDRLPLRLKFYSTDEIADRYGEDKILKVYGKRGTGIAADTCGIHKGELPQRRARLVLNFTYSILPNAFSEYAPIESRHGAALRSYPNRLYLR